MSPAAVVVWLLLAVRLLPRGPTFSNPEMIPPFKMIDKKLASLYHEQCRNDKITGTDAARLARHFKVTPREGFLREE